MKLDKNGITDKTAWEEKGYALPAFDRETVTEKTKNTPRWIHFGAGNIFRAFHAKLAQSLLNEGTMDTGIIVAEGFDTEIIEKIYKPHDDLSVLVTLKGDGSVEKTVVGSVVESLYLDRKNVDDFKRLEDCFAADTLQIATFTITEKGYSINDAKGEVLPGIKADYEAGPENAESYLGKVAALMYHRFVSGKKPIALVSTDNCSHNGDKLYDAIYSFAENWVKNGKAEKGFTAYLSDKEKVSFPWSMIDKITPRPDENVKALLQKDGLEDAYPVITEKKTYIAPFVNAEECEYLVIEDAFPNGRPALEKAGVLFTDRETVEKVERMKVCTCLNPLHTSLAVFGCLLGYKKISDEMQDETLKKMVEIIGYREGLPVVTDPLVIDPKDFIDTVINHRLPNPFMPDTPQRIATDTSQKLAIRFGETVKNYKNAGLDVGELKLIPLVFAGWLRYLSGVDDSGNAFELSPDPLLSELLPLIKNGDVERIISNEKIFGTDLYEAGLADKVLAYYEELNKGPGAVRATLEKYVADQAV
ncbi:MAG: mannitol dehydrogenase family protein [Lachnospiraceae bacterium]|nr:mannitol dehydrogenase family protein [Lachnospiraceae bacterium]